MLKSNCFRGFFNKNLITARKIFFFEKTEQDKLRFDRWATKVGASSGVFSFSKAEKKLTFFNLEMKQ